MIDINNPSGGLVTIRQLGRVTYAELLASFPTFTAIMEEAEGRLIFLTDWRGMAPMDVQARQMLQTIMKGDAPGVVKHALICNEESMHHLQIKMLFRVGGGQSRSIFTQSADLLGWIKEDLTREELASALSFLHEGEGLAFDQFVS